jgi:hypothetical protein
MPKMKILPLKKLNNLGVAHHLLIAAVFVVGFAGFGAWRVFSSSAATVSQCKTPSYAQTNMGTCLTVLGGSIIVTSTGKGGDYVKTDKTHGFIESSTGKKQVNLANPNYAFVKSGYSWKVCNDARLQADNCGNLPSGYKVNLCNVDVSNGGWTTACMLEDAYVRQR